MMGDPKGARQDRQTAEKKIAEYKTRLSDTTYSIYADTTQKFDKLLSFDAKLTGSSFDNATASSSSPQDMNMRLIPLFKFTLMNPDSAMLARASLYHAQRLEDFKKMVGNPRLMLSYEQSNIAPDSLIMMDRHWMEVMRREEPTWIMHFERGVTQSLIKQYTNAVSTLTSAIAANPSNPFLYINRSTTRAEMIDFISSIDNSYQRITIDSDPANRLLNRGSRTYNYDDAIEDINKAIKLNIAIEKMVAILLEALMESITKENKEMLWLV